MKAKNGRGRGRPIGATENRVDHLKVLAVDYYMQGYSVIAIAEALGRDPALIQRWLKGVFSTSSSVAEERALQGELAAWEQAWYWTSVVDEMRSRLMAMSPDDPDYDDLYHQYTFAQASYKEWWDRYLQFRRLRKDAPSSVTVDARQQVVVVGGEQFYQQLQELRQKALALPQPEDEQFKAWLEAHAEYSPPTEQL